MYRSISMNRRYNKQGRVPFQHFNCLYPENRYKQHMQQPIKRIASDSQCLKLVTSAHALVASCINTIGSNIACLSCLLADGYTRAFGCCARGLWGFQSYCKTCFRNNLERQPPAAIMLSCPSVVGFVAVQLGFF